MIKVKNLKKFLVLFFVAFACLGALTLYCTQTAFADVNSDQSSDEFIVGDGDYEVDANADRIKRTTGDPDTCEIIMRGGEFGGTGTVDSVWHVTKKSDKTCCNVFRTIHTYIDGVDYPFDYDIRGYFGDRRGVLHRTSQVQFFYNTSTKTLRVLCFGDGAYGHEFFTYDYSGGTTILEDELKVCSGVDDDPVNEKTVVKSWRIAKEVLSIEIDPRLEKIYNRSFLGCLVLEKVDVIGEKYDNSNLKYIGFWSFDNCGNYNNQFWKGEHFVAFQLFNIYDRKPSQLKWDERFDGNSHMLYYKK